MMTRKRKCYHLCSFRRRFRKSCIGCRRGEGTAMINKTHLQGNYRRRRFLLALRLKHMADTVERVRRELQPLKEETKWALGQLLSIQHEDEDGNSTCRININGSLEEKFRSLLEKCARKEEEISNTTKAIQEKMQEIMP
ncbi:hypothetical protein H6P81_005365 [Aristolochia fimbriata]|uniref:Uncharacterized protein n=1 Tax=Aristolochia fimbriata TaxID=158543 RepID=A0AAV7EXY8_ARIFI|nr:hypothetical protein H6P81_005365 [Aristolochia fimbriata]